jgi:virulence factor Mce-like protein
MKLRGLNPALVAVVVVVVLLLGYLLFFNGGGTRSVTADFPRTVSLYQGSDVRILGVTVGKVDDVIPEGTKVAVRFHYDSQYKIPANAKAVVISPSIVGDRFIQLTPAYTGGPVLADGAVLGLNRTATPLELDQIFGSINDLTVALGPQGANKPDSTGTGPLTRLLDNTARNFGGEGVQFNSTLQNLSKLTQTLADNKDQLFGTVSEVEKFTNALASNDTTVRQFNQSLAAGADLLASERQDFASALQNLSVALTQVRSFVGDNKALLSYNIKQLNQLSTVLVKNRDALDESLKDAPAALNNLALAYDSNAGTLDTRANIGESVDQLTAKPSVVLCAVLPDACGPLTTILKVLGLGRTAPSVDGGSTENIATVPVDRTLAGLVAVSR